jgi:hypothetical protein
MQVEYKSIQIKRQVKEYANAIGAANDNDLGTKIEKLNEHREMGVITEEEFRSGKKKLLD